mgnify:CR=1 FL=1|tara:strand:- start:3 stop:746 length:744 start_codon:yes stop_codon:yes gene_type:complete
MVTPTTRAEFKAYVLRRLGAPVLEINIDEDQLDDRIDDALKYYADYHFDGVEETYYKYQVTPTDVTNKYITLPDNILGAVDVFNAGDPSIRTGDLFNIRYQIALNDLYTLTSVSVIPYYMTRMHLSLLAEILVGKYPLRFNRHNHQLYIDTDWSAISAGNYLIVKAYRVIDPDTYYGIWQDQWFKKYAAALVKKQWGENLKKFTGMQLPGGVQFNGQTIWQEAENEIQQLEHEIIHSYSLPVTDMCG